MGYKKTEQIDKGESRRYKRFLKHMMNRQRRIAEKKLLDYAPKKNEYMGWSL